MRLADRMDPFGHQQFQAQQADRAWAGNQGRVADPHLRQLGNGLHGCREGFAQGRFVQPEPFRQPENLVWPHHRVAGKRAVHAVPHAAPVRTEHEIAGAAIQALAASHRRR